MKFKNRVLWLFGEVDMVQGFAGNLAHKDAIEFEDSGVASLQMKSGILGSINWSVNSFRKNFEIGLTVIAEKGTISLGGEYLDQLRYHEGVESFDVEAVSGLPNNYDTYKGSMSHHKEVYDNLLQAVKNKSEANSNAFDGLKTVEMIEKIYKAVSPSSSHS